MEMPFGKYEGVDIKDIPDDYLLWAKSNLEDRKDCRYSIGQIKYYITKELKKRNPVSNPNI